MKKQKKTENQAKKLNKIWLAVPVLLIMAVFVGIFCFRTGSVQEKSILEQLKNKTGYIRTVGIEEYEFFKKLVDRDMPEEVSEDELEQKTKEKINRVNAEFMLANQMELCGPYSFESFQRDMENENSQRKLKKEKNEVFYGPEEFDLITYYNYISGNLKLDMVTYITENADSQVLDGAKAYFEEHAENYQTIEKINYLLTEDESTQELTLTREEMSTLEKTDSTLFEFLYYGQKDDTMKYSYGNIERTVQIISVEYEELSFQKNIERVVRDYITNVYLEDWIQKIEDENPVEFNLS